MTKRAVRAPAAKKAPAARKTTRKPAAKRPPAKPAAKKAAKPNKAHEAAGKAVAKPDLLFKLTAPRTSVAETPLQTGEAAGSIPAAGTNTVAALLQTPGVPDPAQELTPTQVAFANEYLKDLNGTAAYRRIHPSAAVNTCATESWRILRNPKVRAYIEDERRKLSERFGYTKEDLVADLVAIVKADPAELTRMVHVSCGFCWGGSTKDDQHGSWADPDPDCAACQGQGVMRTWFADTRKLSPEARALFQSVEMTRSGIKVHMESKADAREKLARIMGAYELDNKQRTDPLLELLNSMGRSAMPVVKEPGRNG